MTLAFAAPALAGKRELGGRPLISIQDFAQYPAILTPVNDFFVRNHFDAPVLDPDRWRLRIGGLVRREFVFGLDDLKRLPQIELTSVVECAGNGVGVGAVGCAQWGGVRLRELLGMCGLRPETRFVRITGADRGNEPDAVNIEYSRTMTIEDATSAETLIALRMQGQPLPVDHGAPARVVAAGRYGMDSVKWLQKIDVMQELEPSFYMTQRFRRVHSGIVGEPVGRIAVKSLIVHPMPHGVIRGDAAYAGGYAWAGADPIDRVEVRLDRAPWKPARFLSEPKPLTWVAWRLDIRSLGPGAHTIECRAASKSGQTQPDERDPSRGDQYEINQRQLVRFFSRP